MQPGHFPLHPCPPPPRGPERSTQRGSACSQPGACSGSHSLQSQPMPKSPGPEGIREHWVNTELPGGRQWCKRTHRMSKIESSLGLQMEQPKTGPRADTGQALFLDPPDIRVQFDIHAPRPPPVLPLGCMYFVCLLSS